MHIGQLSNQEQFNSEKFDEEYIKPGQFYTSCLQLFPFKILTKDYPGDLTNAFLIAY